ncbi:MAG: ABC transporter permease subunit/CPBP intramembrane protease [Pirellulales bacterium]
MNWTNVKLIFSREVRDQLRDRRTLFMIAVLPLLLYPLLGMSMFQVLQFVTEHATKVLVIGADELPESPALLDADRFATRWFKDPGNDRLLELTIEPGSRSDRIATARAERALAQGEFEAVVFFPPDFADRLSAFRRSLTQPRTAEGAEREQAAEQIPSPSIFYNTAKEKSQITFARVSQVLERWTQEIGRQNLADSHLPESAARPFELSEHDVAEAGHRDAAVWSKLLPFLLVIWALTGAFYPAVDLCAGEKERGTLETLLSSPAERTEIVWGKLLTVMLFSMVTAILNLVSMGITGAFVMNVLPELGRPPAMTPLWLFIALVPMSALFSALCLALAAFARSTKEGQYYLMPLVLVTMPLVVLPMAPGVELTLGNSLIPVTGVVLLLRAMVEGNYWQALPFVPPVAAVTLACCLWAVRWAVDQFNAESVLFRESERLDFGLWLKHLMRDREATPSASEALFCGVLILLIKFFMNLAVPQPGSFADLAVVTLVSQLVVVATPALLMTVMLTRSPRQTLLLRMPSFWSLPAAAVLALVLHPAVLQLSELVQWLYPVKSEVYESVAALFAQAPSLWQLLLLVAVMPAICEELAFRGFMLSGLRRTGHKWRAIALSSFFFGLTHGLLQQSIVACVVGLLIGYLVVQSGSLLTGIVFHMVHNGLAVASGPLSEAYPAESALVSWLVRPGAEGGYAFQWPAVLGGLAIAALLVNRFRGQHYAKTAEEALQEAIDHQSAHVPA